MKPILFATNTLQNAFETYKKQYFGSNAIIKKELSMGTPILSSNCIKELN